MGRPVKRPVQTRRGSYDATPWTEVYLIDPEDTAGWMPWGSCAGVAYDDPGEADFAYGEGGSNNELMQMAFVNSYCQNGCPVVAQCAGFAAAHPDHAGFGCWGGTTEQQRARDRQSAMRFASQERPREGAEW